MWQNKCLQVFDTHNITLIHLQSWRSNSYKVVQFYPSEFVMRMRITTYSPRPFVWRLLSNKVPGLQFFVRTRRRRGKTGMSRPESRPFSKGAGLERAGRSRRGQRGFYSEVASKSAAKSAGVSPLIGSEMVGVFCISLSQNVNLGPRTSQSTVWKSHRDRHLPSGQ